MSIFSQVLNLIILCCALIMAWQQFRRAARTREARCKEWGAQADCVQKLGIEVRSLEARVQRLEGLLEPQPNAQQAPQQEA